MFFAYKRKHYRDPLRDKIAQMWQKQSNTPRFWYEICSNQHVQEIGMYGMVESVELMNSFIIWFTAFRSFRSCWLTILSGQARRLAERDRTEQSSWAGADRGAGGCHWRLPLSWKTTCKTVSFAFQLTTEICSVMSCKVARNFATKPNTANTDRCGININHLQGAETSNELIYNTTLWKLSLMT